jgi:hypothetical protein
MHICNLYIRKREHVAQIYDYPSFLLSTDTLYIVHIYAMYYIRYNFGLTRPYYYIHTQHMRDRCACVKQNSWKRLKNPLLKNKLCVPHSHILKLKEAGIYSFI